MSSTSSEMAAIQQSATRASAKSRVKRSWAGRTASHAISAEEDLFDPSKSVSENVRESLRQIVRRNDVSKNKKLAHLNGLVKVWERERELSAAAEAKGILDDSDPLKIREIMLCLRIPLTHESGEVRAGALRAIRCLVRTNEEVAEINRLNMHYLIARSLDLDLDNKAERIHALRLSRKMMFASPKSFPQAVVRSVVAIAQNDSREEDRLRNVCLAILCELSILNGSLLCATSGVSALSHALLDCASQPRVVEAIAGALVRLVNDPASRAFSDIRLGCVVAPFTEFRYVHGDTGSEANGAVVLTNDDREQRFACGQLAVLSLLRSWPGLTLMATPPGASPLQALVDILHLQNADVRKQVLSLFFAVLCIRAPSDSAETYAEALSSIEPTSFRDHWKLAEGFVAAEGADILPHMGKVSPNLQDNHRALLLVLLLHAGLPEALVRVIVSAEEAALSVQAGVLLGEFLHLVHVLLPREINANAHCLPTLLTEVVSADRNKPNRASEAVMALDRLHAMKKLGVGAHSLFLDAILKSGGRMGGECFVGDRLHSPSWSYVQQQQSAKNSDDRVAAAVDAAKVNAYTHRDAASWEWDLISAVLRAPGDAFLALDTPAYRAFASRLVDFFKPSNNAFSKVELTNKRARFLARSGCYLLDCFVKGTTADSASLLDELMSDIKNQLTLVVSSESSHDCLFSPSRIATTACQYYFLFIGRLSQSPRGRTTLDKHAFLQSLLELLSLRSDMYLKLVTTCLDYSCAEWGSRSLLGKALRETSETCRLYATRLLGVLLRSRTLNVAQWGVDLMVGQLFDHSRIVPWVALDILSEVCDDKLNLEAVALALSTREPQSLAHLGLRGVFLLVRLVASNSGLKFLLRTSFLSDQMLLWAREYNIKYVAYIEELLNDGFSRHQHNDERKYGRRSHETHSTRNVFVPPHLYGQMASTREGMQMLTGDRTLKAMFDTVRAAAAAANDGDTAAPCPITSLKAAIWGVCSLGTCVDGAQWLEREGCVSAVATLAERSSVLGVRGTSFYALSQVATTQLGCRLLAQANWSSVPHARDDHWPVTEEAFFAQMAALLSLDAPDSSQLASPDEEVDEVDEAGPSREYGVSSNLLESASPSVSPADSAKLTLSGRKRLSKMFRSFSLGSRSAEARDAASAKNFSARFKRRLFRKPSTSAEDSVDQRSEVATPAAVQVQVQVDPSAATSPASKEQRQKQPDQQQLFVHQPRKLSPIASSSSISTEQQQQLMHLQDRVEVVEPSPPPPPKTEPEEWDSVLTRTRGAKPRSGVRALSESEAQNAVSAGMSAAAASGSGSSAFAPCLLPYRTIDSTGNSIPSTTTGATTAALTVGGGVGPGLSLNSISNLSSVGSWTDSPGFMTLRCINYRHRPLLTLSDSAEKDAGAPADPLPPDVAYARKTQSLDHRLLRRSRDATHAWNSPALWTSSRRPRQLLMLSQEACSSASAETRLWGITVPNNLEAMLTVRQSEEESGTKAKTDVGFVAARDHMVGDWLQSHHTAVLTHFHGLEMHTTASCLACFRLATAANGCPEAATSCSASNLATSASSAPRPRADSLTIHVGGAENDAASLAPPPVSTSLQSSPSEAAAFLQLHASAVSPVDAGSAQSLRSDSEAVVPRPGHHAFHHHESVLARILQRKEIIKLIGCMNATVGVKTAEQGLLKLKQKFPSAFCDLCLYSEVCQMLSKYAFRLSARRFIQELFMDLQFDELYEEPLQLLDVVESDSMAGTGQLGRLTEIASEEMLAVQIR